MDIAINTLEISASAVKLVIGYELDSQPYVLYANKVLLNQAISSGEIVNQEQVITAIRTLVNDAKQQIGVEMIEVVLSLPTIDFEVFRGTQTTNTLANKIDRIDIKNIMALFRKNRVDPNKVIVAILPQTFKTESDQKYRLLPLGEVSNTLTVEAFLHVLPLWIYNSYIEVVTKAGLKVTKVYADKYALTELLNNPGTPTHTYFLVDFGAKSTSITFVSNHNLYFTRIINSGSDDLTYLLAERFGLEVKEAERIKKDYGLDRRNVSVNFALAHGIDENGNEVKVYLSDIYKTIKGFLNEHLKKILDEIKIVGKTQNMPSLNKYPLLFVGGGSSIYNFEEIIASDHTFADKYIVKLDTLGARDLTYAVNLGLIKAYTKYTQDIGDERTSIGTLTRS
ncbi:MAG: pilus assembly protein PilM [Bacilli bacterium]|nr:pilus assembly protein PilM [Bacilli bacterium]